ncbi:PIR protein [Plasmodium vivax]|uniref:VIR protein n=1 Tax=Plasmodium vivax TaxID=5855 RepID=A0A564ZR65_PLAVI|nr:PIR protein [Plasmodium vivax]
MEDPDLSGLPSKVYDTEFNNNKKDNTNYCEEISKNLTQHEEIHKICNRLIGNLFYLKDKGNTDNLFQKHCYDLNYWLFEEVSKKFKDSEQNKNASLAIKKLHESWNEAIQKDELRNTNNKCMPEPKLLEKKLLKPIKDVLDYIENFSTLQHKFNNNNVENNKYCSYILEIVPLYLMFQQLCSKINIDICKKYVKNYNKYNPSELLTKLSCDVGDIYKAPLDGSLVRKMINIDQSDFGKFFRNLDLTKLDFKNLDLANLGLTNLNLAGSGLSRFGSNDFSFQDFNFPDVGLSSLNFPGNFESVFTNNIVDLLQKGVDGSGIKNLFNKISFLSDIYNYDIIHKYVVPALYGLGGLLFFFILYKCRRCLPCCCIFRRRKKRRNRLTDFDTSGLMSAPLGFPSPMMPTNPYGLRYQPF